MTKSDFLHLFLNPISLRREVRETTRKDFLAYLKPEMSVYDIGCGDKPFEKFLQGKCGKYVGVDLENGFYDRAHTDLIGSAYNVPIGDGEADAVISCQVLEHLEKPMDALKEANRILAKDGLMFISFPFMYPIHAEPYDFFRYTEYATDAFLAEHGFELLKRTKISGFWFVLGVFSGIYFKKMETGIVKKGGIFKYLRIPSLINVFVNWFCFIFHKLEATLFKLARKDVNKWRRDWASNYVIVARKIKTV